MTRQTWSLLALLVTVALFAAFGIGCAENDLIDDASVNGGGALVAEPGCAGCHTDADRMQAMVPEPDDSGSSSGEG